jgi:acyl dehydratase
MMRGKFFEEFHPGERFATAARTVTEAEIVQFVQLAGLFEPLFLDLEYIKRESLFGERIAPGSLTFALAEGLTVQTGVIHGTAMAFLGLDRMELKAPVKVGDTIRVEIEVLRKKELRSRPGGIVVFSQKVLNQRGEVVLEYEPARLIWRSAAPRTEK